MWCPRQAPWQAGQGQGAELLQGPEAQGRPSPPAGWLAVSRGPLLAAIAFPRSRTLKDLLTLTDLTPA